MRKVLISLMLITLVFTLTGCKKEEQIKYVFNIEEDMGEKISEDYMKILKNSYYMILMNSNTGEEITIHDKDDTDGILNVIKNSRKKISINSNWVDSMYNLYFYDENDKIIAFVELYNWHSGSGKIGFILHTRLINDDGTVISISESYYTDEVPLIKILKKYVNLEYSVICELEN